MEDKNVERLLMEVNAISTKYEFMYKKTGEYFNIFDIVGITETIFNLVMLLQSIASGK